MPPETMNVTECAYCGIFQASNKACARCGSTFYCSKVCQTAHWRMKPGHKELCIKLEDQKPSSQVDENSSVVSSEVKTVAKSNTSGEASTHCFESFFPPAIPFMTKKTVSDNNIPECAYCGTFSAFNKACARCGNTFYCSKACQAVHWKAKLGHKERCIKLEDRKPFSQVETNSCIGSKAEALGDPCNVCFEPLLPSGQSSIISDWFCSTTQTLVCDHSFHSRCIEELTTLKKSSCPLCRGQVSLRSVDDLYERALILFEEVKSLVSNELLCWHDLPPTTQASMLKIMRYYSEASHRGHGGAQITLGDLYANGHGVKQDDKKALSWYRMAANQGYASAQYKMGCLYANGGDVYLDLKEAAYWYQKSADQGNASAQNNLGCLYEKGGGVNQDLTEAVSLFRKAADQGNADAKRNLIHTYSMSKKAHVATGMNMLLLLLMFLVFFW